MYKLNPLFEFFDNYDSQPIIPRFFRMIGFYGSIPFSKRLAVSLYSQAAEIIKSSYNGSGYSSYGSERKCQSMCLYHIQQIKNKLDLYDDEDYQVKRFLERLIEFWKNLHSCCNYHYQELYKLVTTGEG